MEYKLDLRAAHRQPGTIRTYFTTLNHWHRWLDRLEVPPRSIGDIRKEHITAFIAERSDTEAPETVLTRYRHLRAFFGWCERQDSPSLTGTRWHA